MWGTSHEILRYKFNIAQSYVIEDSCWNVIIVTCTIL